MIFSLILALAFAIVAVIFALGNTEPVTVTFLSWQVTQSGALILLGAVALGILIGVLLMTPGAIKRNLILASHKKKLKNTEKELDKHKSKVIELEEKKKTEEMQKEEEQAKALAEAKKAVDEAAKKV